MGFMKNSGALKEGKGTGGWPQAKALTARATPPEAWGLLRHLLWETFKSVSTWILEVRGGAWGCLWGCLVLRRTSGRTGASVPLNWALACQSQ